MRVRRATVEEVDKELVERWFTQSNLRHGHIFGDGAATLEACRSGDAQLWMVDDFAAFATCLQDNRWGRFLTFLGFGGYNGLRGHRLEDVVKAGFVEIERFAEENGAKIEMVCHPAFKRILGPRYKQTGIVLCAAAS